MAKAKLEQKLDYMDVPVVVISKPKGAISRMEAYELMEKAGLFGHYIFPMNISEEVPEDVYDEGDRWELYTLEDLWPKIEEEFFNRGYEACMADYNLLKEN